MLCLWILSYMSWPISLIFSLRMFLVLFSIIFFDPSLDHIKQNKSSNLHYRFFLSKPWYINSEKKLSEKKNQVKKNRPDLPTLFQIK